MTDLYEAGDINQTGGSSNAADVDDVNDLDDDDVNDLDDDDEVIDDEMIDEQSELDSEAGVGNERADADGGTPLAVLTYLAKSLSNDPESVVIETDERRGSLRLSLHVAPDDMSRVIGRRGRTAQAIRTLVNVAGAKDGVSASVDIVDD